MLLDKYWSLTFLVLFPILGKTALANESRIVGGTPTTVDNVPYIVQLLYDGSFICGGSVLSPVWILSAAHCVYGRASQPRRFKVHGGATYLGTGGEIRAVAKVFRSSLFKLKTFDYDVSLLKLASALSGTNIRAISLATTEVPIGGQIKVSGWGFTRENGTVSQQLRSVYVPRIANSVCEAEYQPIGKKITARMACFSKSGKDACSGDSGGPAVYKGKLYGIVSFGLGCARRNYAGVYTDVLKVKSFITRVMKNN